MDVGFTTGTSRNLYSAFDGSRISGQSPGFPRPLAQVRFVLQVFFTLPFRSLQTHCEKEQQPPRRHGSRTTPASKLRLALHFKVPGDGKGGIKYLEASVDLVLWGPVGVLGASVVLFF